MMRRRKRDKNSILARLVSVFLIMVLLQVVFFGGAITISGASSSLTNYANVTFSKIVENRSNYLSANMQDEWSNISAHQTAITDIYNNMLPYSGSLTEEQIKHFFDTSTDELVDMIFSTEVTGGFILLNDTSETSNIASCLYLYDAVPSAAATSKSSLQILRGPSEIGQEHQIPLSSNWTYGMQITDDNKAIMEKPLEAIDFTDREEYRGYWGVLQSPDNVDAKVLTYTRPLIDKNGTVFGVIGVEISQEYLYKQLPFDEFDDFGSYGYILATGSEEENLVPIISQGTVQRSFVTLGEPIEYEVANNVITVSTPIINVIMSAQKLELYPTNSPFLQENIYLIGFVDEASVTSLARNLDTLIIAVSVLSIIIGIAGAYVAYRLIIKPIRSISTAVSKVDPRMVLTLKRSNISEVDELSSAIEKLSNDMQEWFSKANRIMELLDVGVGAFEHRNEDEAAYVTMYAQKVLGIRNTTQSKFLISNHLLRQSLTVFMKDPEPEFDNVYFDKRSGKWYKVIITENEMGKLGIITNVTKEVKDQKALTYQVDYDMLTDIYNRAGFHKHAEMVFEAGNLKIAAVAMFDLDNLKYVNDTFGHEFGDKYIKSAADVMRKSFTEKAVVGRMSGDEFFVLFHSFNHKSEVMSYLNAFYDMLEIEPLILPDGTPFKIRISGGVSWYGSDSTSLDQLIKFADFAMYEGKHTVKGELHTFDKNLYQAQSFMLSGREELNRVLDNQFIEFAFQPIVYAQTGKLYAYEALMRPQSEILNSPLKLLQIAAEQSQLWKIEHITFFKSLATYVKNRELFGDAKLFINSLPSEKLKEDEYARFENMYGEYLHNVVVEMTEGEKMSKEDMTYKLNKITSWGSLTALDDYGSGYNSDLNLLAIDPYIIKLDRSLIENVDSDKARQQMLAKIMGFCREQNRYVLAEGVETQTQMEYLVKAGVDFLQGYYIERPMPLPNFDSMQIERKILSINE